MTDRELIESAARAAGIMRHTDDRYWVGSWWNPLEDDGDALRLAVELGINIFPRGFAEPWGKHNIGRVFAPEAEVKADPCAATRRAIVRAAAEIGKRMKDNAALRTLARLSDEMGEEL